MTAAQPSIVDKPEAKQTDCQSCKRDTVRAFSTAMMLATDPVMVRLPANVLDMASMSYMVCGF